MQRLARKKGEGAWIGLVCVCVCGGWKHLDCAALQRPLLSLLEFNSNDQTGALCVCVCGGSILLQGL